MALGISRMLLETADAERSAAKLASVCSCDVGGATAAEDVTGLVLAVSAEELVAVSSVAGMSMLARALSAASAMLVGDSGGRPQMVSSSLRSARYSRGFITAKHKSSNSDCTHVKETC